uniref:Uncharacterized protein n=1 Tax=Heterorhabditis bacteriophora TaxID=37862 RepID=A0A1I7XUX9_HETBA
MTFRMINHNRESFVESDFTTFFITLVVDAVKIKSVKFTYRERLKSKIRYHNDANGNINSDSSSHYREFVNDSVFFTFYNL